MASDPIRSNPSIEASPADYPAQEEAPRVPPVALRPGAAHRLPTARPGLEEAEDLPPFTPLTPSVDALADEMDSLIGAPTIDAQLVDALRPRIGDPEILRPSRFQSLLDEASVSFASRRSGPDPNSSLFQAAGDVLDEERSLRELFFLYRHALHKA